MFDYRFRIGVFYKNEEWAEKKFHEIYKEIVNNSGSGTCQIISTKDGKVICLGNNSYIKFVSAYVHSRGQKFDRIYYQDGIESDILYSIIYPLISSNNARPLKLEDTDAE